MRAANLALRFGLELASLAGWAALAFSVSAGAWRYGLAIAAIAGIATLWGVFAVPGDPSRSGNAPVPVPGIVRLVLELAILLGGAWGWSVAGFARTALVIAMLVVVHYALSGPRIRWLMQR